MQRLSIGLAVALLLLTGSVAGAQGSTYVASISSNGFIDYDAYHPALSADGRYVAFASTSAWLVPGDNNSAMDVFVHDAVNGTTERVSVDSLGNEGNADSGLYGVAISTDGRYVAFASKATNLVSGDTNAVEDIFVHDRNTGATFRASVGAQNTQANGASYLAALSAGGRYIAFTTDATNLISGDTNSARDVYVFDQANGAIERVSVDPSGKDPNGASGLTGISISGGGRYVAFESAATNLVAKDLNGYDDIFVRDRLLGVNLLASVSSTGSQGNWHSSLPRLSADGRYVAFGSLATNLVAGDTNGEQDVFVRDLQSSKTERVSVSSAGKEADLDCGRKSIAISGDGNVVAFESGASTLIPNYTKSNLSKIFLRDRKAGTTTGHRFQTAAIAGDGPDGSFGIGLSQDGSHVAFSAYVRFVEYDVAPHDYVFVNDRQFTPNPSPIGGSTHLISAAAASPQHPAVSAGGRYVAFADSQHVYVFDRQTGQKTTASVSSLGTPGNGASAWPSISDDGRYVVFESAATNLVSGDTNAAVDVFLHDRVARQTSRLSVSSTGTQANGASAFARISGDGKFVAFESAATNLVAGDTNLKNDVFVRDVLAGKTTRVSVSSAAAQANGDSGMAALSRDGRYVAFQSLATNLVTGDTNLVADVFRRDRLTGVTVRVSVDSTGTQADDKSAWPVLSANGTLVAFQSDATNLVTADANWSTDIFVRDVTAGKTTRVNVDSTGNEAEAGDSFRPSLSADGRYVTFASNAINLVAFDRNYAADVFRHDRQTGQTARVSEDPAAWEGNNSSGLSSQTATLSPRTPIAAGGGTVVFMSGATDLVPDGTTGLLVRDLWPFLSTQSIPKLGQTVKLDLLSPAQAGKTYQAAASFGYRPGIALGQQIVPLDLDPLFFLSLYFPTMFVNFSGTLDTTGKAVASIVLPSDPGLAGITIYSSAVVLDPSLPSAIGGIANALALKLVP